MRVIIALLVLCVTFSYCFDNDLVYQWEGTWSNGKRSAVGGNLYICVDAKRNEAYGAYGHAGLIHGGFNSDGSIFSGNWFEAGYDRPLGSFELTMSSGSSFSGNWRYLVDDDDNGNDTGNSTSAVNQSFSWSGSKNNGARPAWDECLTPDLGTGRHDTDEDNYRSFSASGTYDENSQICYSSDSKYQKTQLNRVGVKLNGITTTMGYSPDGGVSLLTSDFVYPDDDDAGTARYRPENNDRGLGTSFPVQPVDGAGNPVAVADDDDDIPTENIVIGRALSASYTCLSIWRGFYNELEGQRCIHKTKLAEVSIEECAASFLPADGNDGYVINDVISEFVVGVVQAALDQLALPGFYLDEAVVNVNVYRPNECDNPCDDDEDDDCTPDQIAICDVVDPAKNVNGDFDNHSAASSFVIPSVLIVLLGVFTLF